MLASIFVADGIRALVHPDGPAAAAHRVTDRVGPMLQKIDPRIPTDARTLVRVKAAGDVLAGLALATGRATRPAAALLAVGLVPKTLIDSPPVRGQQTQFLKNLGLLGGLLLAAADTEGRPGLRYRTSHAVDRSQRSMKRAVRTARRDAKIAALSASAARKLPG
jgi:putative oxidoreductase